MNSINLGTRITNNYIYPIADGYVLIDTGYEKTYRHFKKRMKKNKIALDDILYIFLTHAHDDHAGFLNQLLHDCSRAKVVLSEKGIEALKNGQNSFAGGCSSSFALFFL